MLRKKNCFHKKYMRGKKKNLFEDQCMPAPGGTERVKGDVWKRSHLHCGVEKKERERDIDRGL